MSDERPARYLGTGPYDGDHDWTLFGMEGVRLMHDGASFGGRDPEPHEHFTLIGPMTCWASQPFTELEYPVSYDAEAQHWMLEPQHGSAAPTASKAHLPIELSQSPDDGLRASRAVKDTARTFADVAESCMCPEMQQDELQDEPCPQHVPVLLEDSGVAETVRSVTQPPSRFLCDFEGCTNKEGFSRHYDLKRHMRTHDSTSVLRCPAVNCRRINGKPFHRADKLRDHLRSGHGKNDLYDCPGSGCSCKNTVLTLLITHLIRGRKPCSRNLMKALSRFTLERCPIDACHFSSISEAAINGRTSRELTAQHLREKHSFDERLQRRAALTNSSYAFDDASMCCPICYKKCETEDGFIQHVRNSHIVADLDHYLTWETAVNEATNQLRSFRCPWKIWYVPYELNSKGYSVNVQCPCGQSFDTRFGSILRHHLDLLSQDDADLRTHRDTIVRIWPEFRTHPVFNELH